MTTIKDVILTAIKFKGLNLVKKEAEKLSLDLLCSKRYILNLCNKVEKKHIVIK